MVVVPTQEEVTLQFVDLGAEKAGMGLSILALAALAVYAWRRRSVSRAS